MRGHTHIPFPHPRPIHQLFAGRCPRGSRLIEEVKDTGMANCARNLLNTLGWIFHSANQNRQADTPSSINNPDDERAYPHTIPASKTHSSIVRWPLSKGLPVN
ncbi:hypothetical protein JTE90_021590 [Oedothorax gibbosus]|uniref:Uncharacterized protein n=1 Tax=Oedothorax gibbosus TaxID=931172 RepID=A0AAV6VND5_9ARAC|nr:hypothetical protein JTE90_021590 [Oedothorax gibbosus]